MTFNNATITSFQKEFDLYTALTLELASHPPIISFSDVVADPESTNLDPVEKEQAPTERESTSIDNIMQLDPVLSISDHEIENSSPTDQDQQPVFRSIANTEPFSLKCDTSTLKGDISSLSEASQWDDLFLHLPSDPPFYSLDFQEPVWSQDDAAFNTLPDIETEAPADPKPELFALKSVGNNPNGRRGIPRCETCRKDKRKCEYTSLESACTICAKNGWHQFCTKTLPPKSSAHIARGQSS